MATDWESAFAHFEGNEKYGKFGKLGLAVFASELRLGFDDVDAFAAEALTDHPDDKKCDLVYVSEDDGLAILAQSYRSDDLYSTKKEASANKASDMSAAVAWLLSGDATEAPAALSSAARDLRSAILDGSIQRLELWFIHNLPESKNVERALETAVTTAKGVLESHFRDQAANIRIVASEIGRETIGELFATKGVPIAVNDDITFDIEYGFPFSGERWRCVSTLISASALRDQWTTHKASLLSPNVREYLGIKRDTSNVNYGIRQTIEDQPENFAIFNNGITVLTNALSVDGTEFTTQSLEDGSFSAAVNHAGPKMLTVTGMGIINGGQTTGSIGELPDGQAVNASQARVMARFVLCDDPDILGNIVKFNNTQNKVEAADFRSTDKRQDELRSEFGRIPGATYRGGRRGGDSDKIARKTKHETLLGDKEVVQALAAFHGDPDLAYNKTKLIWEDNKIYGEIFNPELTAKHIVFTFSLLKSVLGVRQNLRNAKEDELTEIEKEQKLFMSLRGSHILAVAAIGHSIETILDAPVPDRGRLQFDGTVSPEEAEQLWDPVVKAILPVTIHLTEFMQKGLKNKEAVKGALGRFSSLLAMTRQGNEVMDQFAHKVAGYSKPIQ